MRETIRQLKEFHDAFDLPNRSRCDPEEWTEQDIALRVELIREEFEELKDALEVRDRVEVADALADLVYVVVGAAVTFGVPLAEVFQVVHESNMLKLGPDGKPIVRSDGKRTKPPGWVKPDVAGILSTNDAPSKERK